MNIVYIRLNEMLISKETYDLWERSGYASSEETLLKAELEAEEYTPCPECSDKGVVELLFSVVPCSTCGDGP